MTRFWHKLAILIAAPALALAACNGTAASTASDAAVAPSGLDQVPLTVTMGSTAHNFTVEVARTSREQARGMMFRTEVAPDRGMIFPFDQPRIASFWMKDTLIPLDIFFVRADGSIDRIAENTIPMNLEPVVSGGEVSMVLELAGGTAARLGIDESATVRWTDSR
jgi:uncharacterized protein